MLTCLRIVPSTVYMRQNATYKPHVMGPAPNLRYYRLSPDYPHIRYPTHVRSTIGLGPEDHKLGI